MNNTEKPQLTSDPLVRCSDLLADSPTFRHVLDFAFRMEAKLAKNRHKGDRDGWLKDHPWDLVERILDETLEVQTSFIDTGTEIFSPEPEKTADECADVANFCMMTADRVLSANADLSDRTGRCGRA
jgi:hypothetical protein